MELNTHLAAVHGDNGSTTEMVDRYDNDTGMDLPEADTGRDEYRARIDRTWKRAAWRTEMALRPPVNGHHPTRQDSAFWRIRFHIYICRPSTAGWRPMPRW